MKKEYIEITNDLMFPEGPIAMPDGSIILVEIARGTLTQVHKNGSKDIIAELGGGPNGAAIGPDGCVYVCNNGGFEWHNIDGLLIPGGQGDNYSGGRIEKVDLKTGSIETIYTECDLSLIHISEPTRPERISYAVFCLKKKKQKK